MFSPRCAGDVEPIESARCTSVSTSIGAAFDHAEALQASEGRLEQDRLVAYPVGIVVMRPGVGLVVLADAVPDLPPGIWPGSQGRNRRTTPPRLPGSIIRSRPLERVHTIHPMKRPAHDNQVEMAQCRVEVIGAAGDEADVCRLPGQACGPRRSISGEGSTAITSRTSGAKLRASGAGPQPRSSTRLPGAKAGDLGDAADQRRRVRHPASLVVRRSGAVALGSNGAGGGASVIGLP